MIPQSAQGAVNAARQVLAGETGAPQDQITVRTVDAVDWPSSALGCPKPDQVYLQVITPGYRIILVHRGTTYEYHTDLIGRALVRCNP